MYPPRTHSHRRCEKLIGSHWCDLSTNRKRCSRSHLFSGKWESFSKTRQPIIFQGLFEEIYRFARKGKKTLQLFMNQLNTVINEKRVYEPVSFAISKKDVIKRSSNLIPFTL